MFKSRAISNRFLHLQKNVAKMFSKLLEGGGAAACPAPQASDGPGTCTFIVCIASQSLEIQCLEPLPKSMFYVFVRGVYANVAPSRLLNALYFLHNEAIFQQQCFGSIAQPCCLNINQPKTKDMCTFMYLPQHILQYDRQLL